MDHPNERPFSEVVQSGFSGTPLYNPGELECFAGYLNEVMLARERTGQGAQSVNDAVRECSSLEFPWSMRCVSYALNYSSIPLNDLIDSCSQIPAGSGDGLSEGCWEGVGYRGNRALVNAANTAAVQQDFMVGERALLKGLTLTELLYDPAAGARYAERLCGNDPGQQCLARLTLATMQNLQNPQAGLEMCLALRDPADSELCTSAVNAVSPIQGG